jgi:hypothetical protein
VSTYSLAPGAPLSHGPHDIAIRVSSGSSIALSNNSTSSASLGVSIDTVSPTLNDVTFHYDSAQDITAEFDSDVAATVQNTDLNLVNDSTATTITPDHIAVNAASNTAVFSFAGFPYNALPDGYYHATIPAANITDLAGNALGAAVQLAFYIMAGDADHNATVDSADLTMVSANWGQSPRTFSQGDFSYDGRVDVEDFKILTSRWQTSLPPAQSVFSTVTVAGSAMPPSSSTKRVAATVLT